MKNRTSILTIFIAALLCCFSAATFAQVNNTEKNNAQNTETQQIDIYKEFSDNSFQDAVKKITDSTILYQHLIGVKGGYGIANVSFTQDIDHKAFTTPVNFGVYFGFQTGLEYSELGFNKLTVGEKNEVLAEEKQIYKSVQFPMLSQFRVDFWKMRAFVNIGPYGYYLLSTNLEGGIPSTTNKVGVGIMGGGGIALVMNPVELKDFIV